EQHHVHAAASAADGTATLRLRHAVAIRDIRVWIEVLAEKPGAALGVDHAVRRAQRLALLADVLAEVARAIERALARGAERARCRLHVAAGAVALHRRRTVRGAAAGLAAVMQH